MTILGRGDLSPPRRHRPGGRRRRGWLRSFVVLVLLAALGAGGWFGWNHFRHNDTAAARTPSPSACPSSTAPSSAPPLAAAADRPVQVLNGNLRPGLASKVARALHRKPPRVPIGRIGNAARFIRGPSRVNYPAALALEAHHVAAAVFPPPRLVESATTARVQLELGTGFRRMATAAEYQTAVAAFTGSASPSPSSSSCASP